MDQPEARTPYRSPQETVHLIENITEAVCVVDADWRIRYVNRKAEEWWKVSRSDALGSLLWELLPALRGTEPQQQMIRAAETKVPAHFETLSPALGMWIEASAYPTIDGSLLIYCRDVTQRKCSEERIRHQNSVLHGINQVFHRALQCASTEELGRVCMEIALRATGSVFGFIGSFNSDGAYEEVAVSGTSLAGFPAQARHSDGNPKIGRHLGGICRAVLEGGKPFFTNSPATHPSSVGTPQGHMTLSCFLGVPLIHVGTTIGMIGLGNKPGGYSEQDLEALEALANAIAQVLRHKKLEQELSTALKAAEQKNAEFQALFDAIPDTMLVLEEPDRITMRNRASFQVIGDLAEHAEADGWRFSGVINSLEHLYMDGRPMPFEERPHVRAMKGQAVISELYARRTSEGKVSYLKATSVPLPSVNGKRRAVHIARNVTAEHEARLLAEQRELELARRAAEWRAILEHLNDAIYLRDGHGNLLMANNAALRLNGVKSFEEYRVLQLFSPDGTPLSVKEHPMSRALHGEAFDNMVVRYINTVGKEGEALVSGGPVDTPLGRRAFTVWRDVTEVRQLERARQEFMQVVSHEIRNPLQVIKGLVQLLDLKMPPETRGNVGHHLATLHAQINYLTSLVDDILTAYRLGTGKMTIQMSEVLLRQLVDQAVLPYQSNCLHILSLHHDVPDGLVVRVDPQRVVQIISNLLSNAVKYTPEAKSITVKTQLTEGCVMVTVEDEGIGIPADQLERVFDGFHRAHNVTQWKSGGIGLGLYISRSLARRMGGDLWAENRDQGGTRICFKIAYGEQQQETRAR